MLGKGLSRNDSEERETGVHVAADTQEQIEK